jgi:ribosomal protein L11 methyltransferase
VSPESAKQITINLSPIPTATRLPNVTINEDWKEGWKRFFQPVRVGDRLVIRPPWKTLDDIRIHDLELIIDPGMAFGSGMHETTQLCLRALEPLVREDRSVLDVGCGSGILSIAAAKLGARPIVGIDIDEAAKTATLDNAGVNGVAHLIEASVMSLAQVQERYELVVANILSNVLVTLKEELAGHVLPGGDLLLSGMLAEEVEEVATHFRGLDLALQSELIDKNWACLHFVRAL